MEEKLSVSEVGYQMGFSNISHFSRVFEKHIGLKPKKYSAAGKVLCGIERLSPA
jgi:AraC-like DNA-binding protein